jgi:hypothetical protein
MAAAAGVEHRPGRAAVLTRDMRQSTIRAQRLAAEHPERVYAFVAALENHWRLGDRYLRLLRVSPDGRRGRIRIGTPFGISRTATTSVTTERAPRRFGGTATVGARTRADAYWTIEPSAEGARVTLEATVCDAGALDRVLLAAGGRWWLRRRLQSVLVRLEAALAQPGEAASGA